jgi:peptidoglycan/xylan/chitin deacetylase (PgdA/CDA1 family)
MESVAGRPIRISAPSQSVGPTGISDLPEYDGGPRTHPAHRGMPLPVNRRRRRFPFIFLIAVGLVLGTTLGIAAAGVDPRASLLALLPGSSGAGSSAGSGGSSAAPAPVAPFPTLTAGGPSLSGGASNAAPSGTLATTGGPASTPSPGTTAEASPSIPASSGSPSPSPVPSATGGPLTVPATVRTTPRVLYHGDRHRREVALTFDDGYSPTALRQILGILKREKVVATFFPYGWAVHQDPAGWHTVVSDGYPIGNHTLRHVILTTLTAEQVTTEMTRGRRTIDLYSDGRSANFMRPPGGAFNAITAKAVLKAGYPTIVMWDVDTFDWQGPSAATITARAIRGTNGSIVLMHSGPSNTPKALPAIIANYRARGFTFVTVSEILAEQP